MSSYNFALHIRCIVLFFVAATLAPSFARGQCIGLPSVTALGSNRFPAGLCAPVEANVTYTVAFASSIPAGQLELVYDWGDGSAPEILPLLAGSKSYNASLTHHYPTESDCEYMVVMALRYKGRICTNTTQVQKISSWRTDAFNGGDISLTSPATKSAVHLVCEGENVSIVFNDNTNWNCNTVAVPETDPVESPNTEYRWQQIVYNTPVEGKKIPNVHIDGVPVTGTGGADVVANYQDPRGVYFMSAPVLNDDPRRRPSLEITAPGGFGAEFPQAGDEFGITLRYWNFCNPYDDPDIPGPPADPINGDHAPVEKTAYIRVLAPPPALVVSEQSVCFGNTPDAFSVSNAIPGNLVSWYGVIPGSDEPGALIYSGTSTTLALTAHPAWKNNKTPGIYQVWATQRTNTGNATNCESPKVLITRMVREPLMVPDPVLPVPSEVCNGQIFTIALPEAPGESVGGATRYVWTGVPGVPVTASTATTATFKVDVKDFGDALYVDRTVKVNRQYVDSPACGRTRSFTIRVYREPSGGILSGPSQVCETESVGPVTLSEYTGKILRWEIRKGEDTYQVYAGEESGNAIFPGALPPGQYVFRAVVANGPCKEVFSAEQNVKVFANPSAAFAGDDQSICSALQSAALNANFPDIGNGVWTYEKSLPAGLHSPAFDPSDPNTTVVIAAEHAGVYTLRWNVTNGVCSSADDVVIDFGTNPTDPQAGADETVCGPVTVLKGNTPEKGLGNWSVVSGPGGCVGNDCGISILLPGSPASAVELPGPEPFFGAYTLRWSISSGGNNCFLKTDDVVVTFEEPIQVTVPDIQGVCLDREHPAAIEVTGTVTGPTLSLEWTIVSGSGTLVSPMETTSGDEHNVKVAYLPSPDDYDLGEPLKIKLAVSAAGVSCGKVEKLVVIPFERRPSAVAGTDISNVCEDFTPLNATAPLHGAVGTWTTTQSGISFDNPHDPLTTVRNLPIGSTVLTWTVESSNGLCAADPAAVTVTRVPPPDARDINVLECDAGDGKANIVLSNYEDSVTRLPAAQRKISWYMNAAPPSGLPVSDASLDQAVSGGSVFVARVHDVVTGCSEDATVTVQLRPLPPVTNAVVSQCEDVPGGNTLSGIDLGEETFAGAVTTAENVNITWYYDEQDAVGGQRAIDAPVFVTGKKDFYARVVYQDAPYCASLARLDIVVSPQPAITNIVGPESVCQGAASLSPADLPVHVYQVMPIAGAKYYWDVPAGFKVFGGGGEKDFYVLLQFPDVATGVLRVRAGLNGCLGPYIEKNVTVSPTPSRPVIQGPSVVCENSTAVALSVSPDNFPASAYNWEIRRVSDKSIGGAYLSEGQLTGNVLVNFGHEDVVISVRENNSQCVSPVATKVITVTDPPTATLQVENAISCFMESDGSIRTTVTGGSPINEFRIVETNEKDADNDGVFKGLSQGSYTVHVRDENGCIGTTGTVLLQQPQAVVISDVRVVTDGDGFNTSCHDARDGEISLQLSGGGGSGDYTATLLRYNSTDAPLTVSAKDEIIFPGLGAGTYSVIANDASGCSALPVVAFVVSPPPLYAGAIGKDQVICSGQDPDIIEELASPQGGSGQYEFEWQESRTGDVSRDADWTTISGATGPSFDPPMLETENPLGERRYYRRIVKGVSLFSGEPQVCETGGRTEKVTVTVNPTPVVEFSAGAAEVCEGESVALNLRLSTGKAPMEFDYSSSSASFLNQRGPVETTISVADFREDDVFTLLRVTDANGCTVDRLPASVAVNVLKVTPAFTVTEPANRCDGEAFVFTWEASEGIDYRWEWGDGSVTTLVGSGVQQTAHSFASLAAGKETTYPVKLFASYPGCIERVATRSVTVSPAIRLNILATDSLLCSGETITFYNNSTGVDHGTWHYTPGGDGERIIPLDSSDGDMTLSFTNTSAHNPRVFEVTFEAENAAGCKQVFSKKVSVFRSNDAAFEVGPVPAFEVESVNVGIHQASEVVDEEQFRFFWNFGEQGVAKAVDDPNDFEITYFSPGLKEISLNLVNIQAQAAGKVCQSTFRQQINIPVSEVKAEFTASPFASCFPATVKVENLSTGADTYLWRLSRGSTVITTSNLRHPEFLITDPGTYDLHLTVSVAGTGQRDEALLSGIRVLEVPDASFELRSKRVYVPDMPIELMNFSTGATEYAWDFGDGFASGEFEPSHVYTKEGTYAVTLVAGLDHGIVDLNGDGTPDAPMICYDSTQREIIALPGGELVIPNAFTPDTNGPGDGRNNVEGYNDVFLPAGKGISEFSMQIYDRWGTLIFQSGSKDIGWDGYDSHGRLLPAGVYVYKVVVRTSKGESVTRAGDVTLIR